MRSKPFGGVAEYFKKVFDLSPGEIELAPIFNRSPPSLLALRLQSVIGLAFMLQRLDYTSPPMAHAFPVPARLTVSLRTKMQSIIGLVASVSEFSSGVIEQRQALPFPVTDQLLKRKIPCRSQRPLRHLRTASFR